MVLLSIVGRQLHFHLPGTDAYAGYLMAAAGFLALAHTLKKGEHIRVTLLLSARARRAPGVHSRSGRWLRPRCWQACRPGTPAGCPGCRTSSTTSPPATTPRRCGSRRWRWRSGSVILAIAFADEFVLELRGRRARPANDEALHNE
jgi:hypothetical protein